MDSIMTCSDYLSMAPSRQSQTISSWATMLIVANNRWKQFAYSLPTKSNIQRTFSCLEGTTSVQASTESTASTRNAREDTPSNYGKHLLIVSTACQLLPLVRNFSSLFLQGNLIINIFPQLTRKFSAVTAA